MCPQSCGLADTAEAQQMNNNNEICFILELVENKCPSSLGYTYSRRGLCVCTSKQKLFILTVYN